MKKNLEVVKAKRILRGKLLKEARIRAKLSRREFHQKIDTTYKYLCALESGDRGLTIDMLEKIADVLGVQISDILKR